MDAAVEGNRIGRIGADTPQEQLSAELAELSVWIEAEQYLLEKQEGEHSESL